jgi:hypothetical protein
VEPARDTGPQDLGQVERVRSGLHLVVEGHLNPAILVPKWFRSEGLLREEEVRIAETNLEADSSFAAFRTRDFSIVVSLDRLELFSNHEGMEPVIRDLLLNIFTLLRHTPLSNLTISRSAHLANSRQPSMPPDWSGLISPQPFEPVLGTFSVVNVSAAGTEGPVPQDAEVVISIQPSKDLNATLFVECRYEYGLPSDNTSTDRAIELLKNVMETTRSHSEGAFDHFSQVLLREQPSRW